MVGTAVLAVAGVSALFSVVVVGGLVAVFRALERDEYETAGRRKLARTSYGLGAVLSFPALVGISATLVADVGPVFGFDAMLAGVGLVAVAALPLTLGLVLGVDEQRFEP